MNDYRSVIVGDLGVGGERGIVYSPKGIAPCESATQYKDPTKILVEDGNKEDRKSRGGDYSKQNRLRSKWSIPNLM